MTDVTVRETTVDDVHDVQRVARAGWHAAYDDIFGPERVEETVDSWYDPERLVADDVRDPERPFFVGEHRGDRPDDAGPGDATEGDIVGFAEAAAGDEPGVWQLYRIYVHPDAWGEGVGTLLLAEIEAAVRERGVEELRVSVHAENDVGVSFYEARGFDRVGTEPDDLFGGRRHEYAKPL
jgi:ribosomal protein S18 acetylase RimI-like enzyme